MLAGITRLRLCFKPSAKSKEKCGSFTMKGKGSGLTISGGKKRKKAKKAAAAKKPAKKKGGKKGKLTGAAKKAFLARMAKGRKAAAAKRK